jgi:thiol-disulfide isomerase/thioredoxin
MTSDTLLADTIHGVMRVRTLALMVTSALLAAGCATDQRTEGSEVDATTKPSSGDSPPTGAEEPTQNSGSTEAVPDTLDFTATTVEGGVFRGESLVGSPVLLWFWAPWCPTCRSQVPQVEDIAAEYDGRVAVVGVGSLDSAEAIEEFAAEVQGVVHLEDSEGVLYRKFGIAEQSSFVLLDANGDVAYEVGYGGSDDLAAEVADVVG